MKKLIDRSLFLAVMAMMIVGCQKEVLVPAVAEDSNMAVQPPFSKAITVENGCLVFENDQHLEVTLERLSLMSPNERIDFENKIGFRSLGSLYYLINESETTHQEEFFKGLDPNLEVEDYEDMGYFYQNTPLFTEYLRKGVINEIIHQDKSKSFELSIDNPSFENVLNEKGIVIVGDRKLLFEGTNVKEFSLSTNALISHTGTQKISSNGQYNFTKNARRPGYETASGNKYWIVDPAKGNKYRYYAQVFFSSAYSTSVLSQTFYWTARAEQKKFGNWATRNGYTPIFGISASWKYDYWIIFHGQGFGICLDSGLYPLPNSSGWPTSPYNLSNLNTNYTVRNLHPNGLFTRSSTAGWDFFENLRIYTDAWLFKFSGGSSGYSYIGQ